MFLTNENYFSSEANWEYMSNSQFKQFLECPSKAMAMLRGDYVFETTISMKIGSYVDAYFEGTLNDFARKNSDIFLKNGIDLKKEYRKADYIIERIESDPKMMMYLSGQKQVIKTGKICGVKVKIKMDSYFPGKGIVDLKIMKDFAPMWKDRNKLNFVEFWKYDMQGTFYTITEGSKLPFYLVCATKEKEPDMVIININQDRMDDIYYHLIEPNIQYFDDIKKGKAEASRCEKCDWCRRTRNAPIIDFNNFDKWIGDVI